MASGSEPDILERLRQLVNKKADDMAWGSILAPDSIPVPPCPPAFFEPLPEAAFSPDLEIERLRSSLLNSFAIPSAAFARHPETAGRDVAQRLFESRMHKMQDAIEQSLFGPRGEVSLDQVCTTSSSESCPPITAKVLLALMEKVKAEGPTGPLKVVTNRFLVERKQVRFPKTKKRRIRRKWAKRPENWADRPSPQVYLITMGRETTLHGHPETVERALRAAGIENWKGGEAAVA